MNKSIGKEKIKCGCCGVPYTAMFFVWCDADGHAVRKEQINQLNGPYCAKCNVEYRKLNKEI